MDPGYVAPDQANVAPDPGYSPPASSYVDPGVDPGYIEPEPAYTQPESVSPRSPPPSNPLTARQTRPLTPVITHLIPATSILALIPVTSISVPIPVTWIPA